jgi:type III secretion protein L
MYKFFSLLSKKEVTIKAGKKIIPEGEFTLLKKANEILKEVKKEALEYKKEVTKECELLKESAYKTGFDEALLEMNKHILHLSHEIKNFAEEMKKMILPISLKAAKKILKEELRLHPDRILDIITQSLKPVMQHKQIKLYVNKEDLDILEKNKNKIKKILEQVEIFSIEERDDIEKGGCIIETEAGIINAQLENLWRTLELAFESYLKTKKEKL